MDELDSDSAAQAEQAKARRQREIQVSDFKWLMKHAQGRRFMNRLLERTGVHRSSFNHSGSVMAFNEGRRDLGLFLTAELLELTPDAYLQLLKEYGKDE